MKIPQCVCILVGFIFTLVPAFANQADGKIVFEPVQDKSFTLVYNHAFLQRHYINQAKVEFMEAPLPQNIGPDKEIISLFSAIKHNNFEWWLGIWDQQARRAFASDPQIERSMRSTFNYYQQRLNHGEMYLTEWLVVKDRVWLQAEIRKPDGSVANQILLPFALEEGRFRLSASDFNTPLHKAIRQALAAQHGVSETDVAESTKG
ncbi:hypothetical protein [Thaumasiovibrio subtropicus]|uniref:hypothetical protein n=1 Tax=Thaumasiovibrio subtropicus TaxID=1891207 RepID=UPI000B363726|nr:hypothetical protein [Thaumasiovibrio subtropicus]